MDDKASKELAFKQEGERNESNAPLYLIRDEEMEISGRVLAAKQEAERIIADARKKASEVVSAAEIESEDLARRRESEIMAAAEDEAGRLRESVTQETGPLEALVAERGPAAVDAIVSRVTRV